MSICAPKDKMRPVHVGEVLREEFLIPLGMSASALALALHIPAPRITELVREKRGMTLDTACRLSRYFGTSVEFWLGLQQDYELATLTESALKSYENIRPLELAE